MTHGKGGGHVNNPWRVEMEIREAIKEAGMTVREAADVLHVAYETLRGYLYRGVLPSLETTYHMAARLRRPIRLHGPRGTVVVTLEEKKPAKKRPKALPLRLVA